MFPVSQERKNLCYATASRLPLRGQRSLLWNQQSCENLLLLLFQLHLELCDLVAGLEDIRIRQEEKQEVGAAPLEEEQCWWEDLLGPDLQLMFPSQELDGLSSVSQPTYVPHALAFKQAYTAKVVVRLGPGPSGSWSAGPPQSDVLVLLFAETLSDQQSPLPGL